MANVKPVLKWVGGKTQLLDTILPLFPTQLKNYHEPFLGGGSVLLGLLSKQKAGTIKITGTISASDVNANLIGLYINLQQKPEQLIAELKTLTTEFSSLTGTTVNRKPKTLAEAKSSQESYYYWTRSRFTTMTQEQRRSPLGSALLLFLNKTCFRGVYREGPHGFNVPFGHYKNPGILDEAHLHEVSQLIQGVVFSTASFAESLANVQPGDFVYLDPPYAPEAETSFVGYVADGFSLEQHQSLFNFCTSLEAKDVKFLMSNADVKLVKDAFPPATYPTKIVEARRAIHSKKPETKTKEVLISNYS